MAARKPFFTGLRILAVCLLLAICFAVGSALSGIDKIAQQSIASQPNEFARRQAPQVPDNFPGTFLIFVLAAGSTVSYLILRSRWHGWTLAGAIFVGMYGISTVASQVETLVFLSDKMPSGMIRALFVQGAIASALFAPLAVLTLGKWRADPFLATKPPAVRWKFGSILPRAAILVAAFVFLYMFFGYYVAWRNPELRRYYGGEEQATFWAGWQHNWTHSRWIYGVAVLRALLHIACLYPLVRMLYTSRRESALAAALFLSCWTTVLLLPNPLMPASVARSHFWETLGFNLVFGALAGWLLCVTAPAPQAQPNVAAGFAASKL